MKVESHISMPSYRLRLGVELVVRLSGDFYLSHPKTDISCRTGISLASRKKRDQKIIRLHVVPRTAHSNKLLPHPLGAVGMVSCYKRAPSIRRLPGMLLCTVKVNLKGAVYENKVRPVQR